ncbi:MAG: hypothetical protein ACU0DI_04235 [Paracoccaceae bacterium]
MAKPRVKPSNCISTRPIFALWRISFADCVCDCEELSCDRGYNDFVWFTSFTQAFSKGMENGIVLCCNKRGLEKKLCELAFGRRMIDSSSIRVHQHAANGKKST